MADKVNKIVITTGDPNGIGAEITIKALEKLNLPPNKVAIISNRRVLEFYAAKQLGSYAAKSSQAPSPDGEGWDGVISTNISKISQDQLTDKNLSTFQPFNPSTINSHTSIPPYFYTSSYELIEIPYDAEIEPGKVTKEAGEFSFQSVKKACEIGAKAIVTAPVAKNAMHLAGHYFNGQTEILQKYLAHDNQLAEMLFVAGNFRVLLLTRHVPLKEVNLTKEMVVEKITNLKEFFVTHLGILEPKFALCGFNPHSGEDGILGREEIEILQPAVDELRAKGINITNPMPADTLFVGAAREYLNSSGKWKVENGKLNNFQLSTFNFQLTYDCYIANYHDQGLIPIKTVAGDKTVNMTIGLDIIRTSPGHGTAFDIAGKNIADETGMIEAIKTVL